MKKLENFSAALFDIDRTLIPPSREIMPEVVESLRQLHERTIKLGVCSGRGFASIKNVFMPIFPMDSIHILAGGSLVVSNSGEVLWQKTIDPTSTKELRDLIRKTSSVAIFMKPDAQYAEGKVLENIKNHPWKQIGKDLGEMELSGVGLIYVADPGEVIREFVKNNPNLSYKSMMSNKGYPYYDITAKGVTKALAMKKWSETTEIPSEKIIGFGDSANDLEFLQNCGFAIAMGNADDEIKNIADRVIGEVTEKGLPKYIQKILEGENL